MNRIKFFCLLFGILLISSCTSSETSPQTDTPIPPTNTAISPTEIPVSPVDLLVLQEEIQPIEMTLNGSIMTISEGVGLFDVDLEGDPGAANGCGLAFSHPVDYTELPAGNKCIDLGNGEAPDGLLITTDSQINIIFDDGSMLFGNGGEDGYVCFAPDYAYAPYNLAGGIGRFEGATGHLQFDLDTHPFGEPGSPVVPETGTGTGEIIIPHQMAAAIENIVGSWRGTAGDKGVYLHFYEDGTVNHAFDVDIIDSNPHATDAVTFDGTQMKLQQTYEDGGVLTCGNLVGVYEVQLNSDGTIELIKISDDCTPRVNLTALLLEPVP